MLMFWEESTTFLLIAESVNGFQPSEARSTSDFCAACPRFATHRQSTDAVSDWLTGELSAYIQSNVKKCLQLPCCSLQSRLVMPAALESVSPNFIHRQVAAAAATHDCHMHPCGQLKWLHSITAVPIDDQLLQATRKNSSTASFTFSRSCGARG